MKKTALALGITLAAMAMPLQAIAVPPTKGDVGGQHAVVYWEDPVTGTNANVYADEHDDYLLLSLQTYNRDADGNVIGSEVTLAESNLSPYGSLQVDKHLATATVSVTDVPAQRCTYDLNFEVIGECDHPFIDAQATFTGVGAISREPFVFHGEDIVVHVAGPSRQATAFGTVAGMTFTDAQVPLTCEEDGNGLPLCGSISRQHGKVVQHVARPSAVKLTSTYVPDGPSGCTGTFVIDYTFAKVDPTYALTPFVAHQYEIQPDVDYGYDVYGDEAFLALPKPVTKGTYHFEVPVSISDGDINTPDIVQVEVQHSVAEFDLSVYDRLYYDVIESGGTCTLSPGDGQFG